VVIVVIVVVAFGCVVGPASVFVGSGVGAVVAPALDYVLIGAVIVLVVLVLVILADVAIVGIVVA